MAFRYIALTHRRTDAPCSALSVIYTDAGEFDRYLLLPNNPDRVIVDTKIVAGAPALSVSCGYWRCAGDLVRSACLFMQRRNHNGGRSVYFRRALALAELCFNTLIEEGEKSDAGCRAARGYTSTGAHY